MSFTSNPLIDSTWEVKQYYDFEVTILTELYENGVTCVHTYQSDGYNWAFWYEKGNKTPHYHESYPRRKYPPSHIQR